MSNQLTPEESLEEARQLIGVETEPVEALYPIEYEPIRRYCHAGWDENPLFTDPEYANRTRYGQVICPALGIMAIARFPGGPLDSPFPPPRQKLPELPPIRAPGKSNVVLGVEWEFFKPVKVGDRLSESKRYRDIYMKSIRIDPKAFFFVTEHIFRNQNRDVVAICSITGLFHRSPEEVKTAGDA